MSDLRTQHTEAELIAIFKEQGIDEKYFDRFLKYYKNCFEELFEENKQYKDEDFAEGESVQKDALICTTIYTNCFMKEIPKGHGDEWAIAVADSAEDDENAYGLVYDDLNKSNPELAKKELLILCKSYSGDEYFEKHFIYLYEEGSGFKGCAERAKKYSKIYKEQLDKGKSEVYAHEYAELMSCGEYHKIYCEEYAFAYDKAISENKSNEYARVFADEYASALVDIKRRYGISDDEEMLYFAIEKVNAFMKAWEYAKEHQLKDFKRFADIYENEHLNRYSPDEITPNTSVEELDKLVLEKTLTRFNK